MKVIKELFIIIAFIFVQCGSVTNKKERILIQEAVPHIYRACVFEYFDKMGIDSSEYLNSYETEYLNEIFNYYTKKIDLTGKKVCFFGPMGLVFSNKKKYFDEVKKDTLNLLGDLYIFDPFQKEEIGYDVAIVYWNKRLHLTKDIVEKLKSKQ